MKNPVTIEPAAKKLPLHRVSYKALSASIRRGDYAAGDRLPSEAELCQQFDASRITVAKAIQGLQQDGLVTRRPGSGSYVQMPARTISYQFCLLIPELAGGTLMTGCAILHCRSTRLQENHRS